MATKKKSGAQQPLAIELLESDHRKVEMLFDQFEDMKDEEDEGRREVAERICAELTVHAQVEEELFYPWLRENLGEEEMEMVEEAQVEHNSAKDLIAQIQGASALDATYDAKVKVLSEYINHHVQEEENEIFEEVREEREALDELGQEMAARKAELMEQMGLTDDAEGESAMTQRGKKGGESSQRAR